MNPLAATDALRRLAEMLLLAGEDAAAHAVLQELAGIDPLNAAKGEATRALLQGHLGQALLLARRTAERHPDDLEAALLTAHCLAALGRLAEARVRLERATQAHPQSAIAWLHWAELMAQLGDLPAARRILGDGLAQRDDAAVLWLALARWQVKADAPEAAIEAYRQALVRAPLDRDSWLESAAVLLEATTPEAAALWLEVALAGPLARDPEAHLACAQAWIAAGEGAKADAWRTAAARIDPRDAET